MIYPLHPSDHYKVAVLFAPLSFHLSTESILAGETPAQIFVDHPHAPTAAFTIFKHRMFLAGSPDHTAFNQAANLFIEGTIIPEALAAGRDAFVLYCEQDRWEPHLDEVLKDRYPLRSERQYYECNPLNQDWRIELPGEFRVVPVDAWLMENEQLKNFAALREELQSERVSAADFLEKSFGFAIVNADAVVSWCLSEYNTQQRCEVGVATVEEFQRCGLGRAATLAFLELAFQAGYQRVGWHCWKNNAPSGALARSAGFTHIYDYPAYLCVLDRSVQLALHGNQQRRAGDDEGSLAWYEKALAIAQAPAWIHVSTAAALAKLNRNPDSLHHLQLAFELGFSDRDSVRANPDFENLHADPAWQALLE